MGLNLRTLGAEIGRAGLWGKTLNSLTPEDVHKLEMAFVQANLDGAKTCGSCWFYGFVGHDGYCLHVEHPARAYVWSWSLGCQDYSYLFDKGTPKQPLKRANRLDELPGQGALR